MQSKKNVTTEQQVFVSPYLERPLRSYELAAEEVEGKQQEERRENQ